MAISNGGIPKSLLLFCSKPSQSPRTKRSAAKGKIKGEEASKTERPTLGPGRWPQASWLKWLCQRTSSSTCVTPISPPILSCIFNSLLPSLNPGHDIDLLCLQRTSEIALDMDVLHSSLQRAQNHPFLTALVTVTVIATLAASPARIIGMAKIRCWHSTKSLTLKTKDGQTISFADLCKSLIPPCRLNPFLFNGHLQTIWTVMTRESVPIYYKRRIFENSDPVYTGQFSVDFVTKPNDNSDPNLPPRTTYFTEQEFSDIASLDNRPMLVMLHGLSGGSHELYLRHVLSPLVADGGWEACVVISRGCSKTKITSSVLYNARATWDIRQTVKWLRETFPNRPLFGIGFSLGANIMTNVAIRSKSSIE